MTTLVVGARGNPGPLDGEIRRLVSLRDQLCSTADEVDRLRIDTWAGSAQERWAERRAQLSARCRHVAGLCEEGVRALDGYRMALVDSLLPGRSGQLDPAVAATGRTLDRVNQELAELRSLFDTLPRPREAPRPPVHRPPLPRVEATLGSPGNPTYSRDLADVSAELLGAEFEELREHRANPDDNDGVSYYNLRTDRRRDH